MAKLTKPQIEQELKIKNLTMVTSFDDYKSLSTALTVKCLNGHEIQTNLKSIRLPSFSCPVCIGRATKGFTDEPLYVPEKTGERVVGFDNASHRMGVSIFDGGKLVYYTLMEFNHGTAIQRLNKIRDTIENMIIPV